jgi:hypothetical protein
MSTIGSCIIRALTLGIGLIKKQLVKLKEIQGNHSMGVDNAGEMAHPAYIEDLDTVPPLSSSTLSTSRHKAIFLSNNSCPSQGHPSAVCLGRSRLCH